MLVMQYGLKKTLQCEPPYLKNIIEIHRGYIRDLIRTVDYYYLAMIF